MRKEKSLLLNAMTDVIEKSESLVLTSYKKMSANTAANFRNLLREAGGELTVVKKNIFLKAAEKAGLDFGNHLDGHIGVITVQDRVIDATKALYKFIGENEDMVNVLLGWFENRPVTSAEVKMISQLPTQNEMRAQLLSVFEAPMSHTLSVIEEFLKTLVEAKEEQTSEQS